MAVEANAILQRVVKNLSQDDKKMIFETANGGGKVVAACIIAEALIKLGESIERAADKLKVE